MEKIWPTLSRTAALVTAGLYLFSSSCLHISQTHSSIKQQDSLFLLFFLSPNAKGTDVTENNDQKLFLGPWSRKLRSWKWRRAHLVQTPLRLCGMVDHTGATLYWTLSILIYGKILITFQILCPLHLSAWSNFVKFTYVQSL